MSPLSRASRVYSRTNIAVRQTEVFHVVSACDSPGAAAGKWIINKYQMCFLPHVLDIMNVSWLNEPAGVGYGQIPVQTW